MEMYGLFHNGTFVGWYTVYELAYRDVLALLPREVPEQTFRVDVTKAYWEFPEWGAGYWNAGQELGRLIIVVLSCATHPVDTGAMVTDSPLSVNDR